jgi:hypothetical protein
MEKIRKYPIMIKKFKIKLNLKKEGNIDFSE